MKKFSNSLIILTLLILVDNYSSLVRSVDDLLIPIPLNISKGEKTIIFNQYTFFRLSYDENINNSIFQQILEIYENIINNNSRHTKYLNIYNSDNLNVQEIKIKVKNLIMKRYSNNYSRSNEEYNIIIKESQEKDKSLDIEIEAFYLNGLIYGLETLSQILYLNDNSVNIQYEIYNVPIHIYDKPRFSYRGLMIDTSRHYISMNIIKKILNGLMFNKMNILHWHIIDDEYFGFGSDMTRDLTYAYSKSQIKEIIEYAHVRGVTVILELDNPSHTRSWTKLHYDNKQISDLILVMPEYGTLDPSKNLTYKLVGNLIEEALELFENNMHFYDDEGIFIHLGGDEVLSFMWSTEDIEKFMMKHRLNSTSELENYYFNEVRRNLPTKNSYIYWVSDQARQVYDVYNLENSVLMYWGIQENIYKFLDSLNSGDKKQEEGTERKIILASGDYLYLDCGTGNKYGDNTWCGDYKTWKTIYSFPLFDKYNNFNIIGSEVTLFGELADEYSIIGKIFPRINSLSEILWNDENKQKDIKNFFYRLLNHNRRLIKRGIEVSSITTQLCENDPEECIDKIQ